MAFELQRFFPSWQSNLAKSRLRAPIERLVRGALIRSRNIFALHDALWRGQRRGGAVLHLTKYPREGVRLTTRDKVRADVTYIRRPLADTGAKTDSELMRR